MREIDRGDCGGVKETKHVTLCLVIASSSIFLDHDARSKLLLLNEHIQALLDNEECGVGNQLAVRINEGEAEVPEETR